MVITVYEYGGGGKCVWMIRYTYAGISVISIQIEEGDRHRSRVMGKSRAQ